MEIFVGWIVFSIVAGWVASSKGRSGFGVFLLSLILSPLVGLIVAFAMQRGDALQQAAAARSGVAGGFRKCPFCAEVVKAEAVKCKHCGSALDPVAGLTDGRSAAQIEADKARVREASRKVQIGLGIAAVVIFVVIALLTGGR